jgi:hypothetical protein
MGWRQTTAIFESPIRNRYLSWLEQPNLPANLGWFAWLVTLKILVAFGNCSAHNAVTGIC